MFIIQTKHVIEKLFVCRYIFHPVLLNFSKNGQKYDDLIFFVTFNEISLAIAGHDSKQRAATKGVCMTIKKGSTGFDSHARFLRSPDEGGQAGRTRLCDYLIVGAYVHEEESRWAGTWT